MIHSARCALVVAAHPDDEVLGCGGLMARLADAGVPVHVAFLADGVQSRAGDAPVPADDLHSRRRAAHAAAEILGVRSLWFGDCPDNRMDTVPLLDVAKSVERLIAQHQPDLVLTHHGGDLNIDHRCVHQAVATACRPQRGHPVNTVLCFEVPSSTEWQLPGSAPAFEPQCFVDIGATLARKLAALQAYADELRDWPHPRSTQGVQALAQWRGATMGASAAEAFVLARHRT